MSVEIVKRVSKYDIKTSHELFSYCDSESFKSKNLRNLANYHIRQCFILSSKDKDNLSREQIEYLENINYYIGLFNEKKKPLFYEKKPKKIEKAKQELENFIKNSPKSTKKYKENLEKKQKAVIKAEESDYKSHKLINSDNGIISYDFLDFYFSNYLESDDNPYKAMAVQTSQQVLRTLFKDWKSYFATVKDYKKNKHKYKGVPKIPKYKAKNGRNKLSMTNQSCKVKEDVIILPKTKLTLKIGFDTSELSLKEVRIVPMGSIYKMELVWDKKVSKIKDLNKNAYAGIDLGLSNLATITNNMGLKPIIINGKPLKSMNQYYNKKKSEMQKDMPFYTYARYDKKKGININEKRQLSYSKKMDTLTRKRNAKIEDYMHKASASVVNYCIENSIGNIVIGKNDNWKNEINIGSKNNQNFVSIPFNKFINMIKYKAEGVGISVSITEESYTSKSSFLDFDDIPVFKKDEKQKFEQPTCEIASNRNEIIFSGKRIKRGLYKTGRIVINSDVNGSYNILRKFKEDLFSKDDLEKVLTIPKIFNINGYVFNKKKLA